MTVFTHDIFRAPLHSETFIPPSPPTRHSGGVTGHREDCQVGGEDIDSKGGVGSMYSSERKFVNNL